MSTFIKVVIIFIALTGLTLLPAEYDGQKITVIVNALAMGLLLFLVFIIFAVLFSKNEEATKKEVVEKDTPVKPQKNDEDDVIFKYIIPILSIGFAVSLIFGAGYYIITEVLNKDNPFFTEYKETIVTSPLPIGHEGENERSRTLVIKTEQTAKFFTIMPRQQFTITKMKHPIMLRFKETGDELWSRFEPKHVGKLWNAPKYGMIEVKSKKPNTVTIERHSFSYFAGRNQ